MLDGPFTLQANLPIVDIIHLVEIKVTGDLKLNYSPENLYDNHSGAELTGNHTKLAVFNKS